MVWTVEGQGRESLFELNLKNQRKHWPTGSVSIESLPSWELNLKKVKGLISWDRSVGYRNMYLHTEMRDTFLFSCYGQYFRCIALPFGWGRSAFWFTQMMQFTSPEGLSVSTSNWARERVRIAWLLGRLGIKSHIEKSCWCRSKILGHIFMHIDMQEMKVQLTDGKVEKKVHFIEAPDSSAALLTTGSN